VPAERTKPTCAGGRGPRPFRPAPGVLLLGAPAGAAVSRSPFGVAEARGRSLDWPGDGIGVELGAVLAGAKAQTSAVLPSHQREEDYAASPAIPGWWLG
jgi:hypothetical protein